MLFLERFWSVFADDLFGSVLELCGPLKPFLLGSHWMRHALHHWTSQLASTTH